MPFSGDDGLRPFAVRATALALVLTAPALVLGAVFGHDVYFHATFSTLFHEQLVFGDVYPRWLFDAYAGFGAPVFYFYGSVPFYVTSLFASLGLDVWHQLGLAAFVALLASGIAAFVWARGSARASAATAAALLYMALPYHLNVDLYERFAFAEFWSFVWMPLVLAGIDGVARRQRHAWLLCAVPYALLIATHPPSTLLFSCLCVPYAACRVIVARSGMRVATGLRIAAATSLGIGLAGLYLVPALTTQAYAGYAASFKPFHADSFLPYERLVSQGTLGFAHLLEAGGPDASRVLVADAIALSVLLCIVCAGLAVTGSAARGRRVAPVLWLAVALFALLATAEVSRAWWTWAMFLQRIQFPSRFGLVATLAVIPLVAAALDRGPLGRPGRMLLWLSIAAAIASFWLPTAKDVYWGHAIYGGMTDLGAAIPPPEHRPAGASTAALHTDTLAALDRSTPRATLVDGVGVVTVTEWSPRAIRLVIDSATGGTVVLHQFFYPGWHIVADPNVLIVAKSSTDGLLSIVVPPGVHRWYIARGMLGAEWVGLGLSIASSVAALATLWLTRRRSPGTTTSARVRTVALRGRQQ